jgi:hypothetical protein
MSESGFKLRGADNQGRCYNLQKSLISDLKTSNFLISTPDEELYFDDPTLLFDDSTIYGCSLQLTKDELKKFCNEKQW